MTFPSWQHQTGPGRTQQEHPQPIHKHVSIRDVIGTRIAAVHRSCTPLDVMCRPIPPYPGPAKANSNPVTCSSRYSCLCPAAAAAGSATMPSNAAAVTRCREGPSRRCLGCSRHCSAVCSLRLHPLLPHPFSAQVHPPLAVTYHTSSAGPALPKPQINPQPLQSPATPGTAAGVLLLQQLGVPPCPPMLLPSCCCHWVP